MAHVLRVPKFDLSTILAQQNPHIDLRIDSYETSTRNFLKAVSNYTHIAQAEITQRKNTHVQEKKRLTEKIQSHENDTNVCKVKELELIAGATFRLLLMKYQRRRLPQSLIGNAKKGRKRSYQLCSSNGSWQLLRSSVHSLMQK
jgi:hypothetical protein